MTKPASKEDSTKPKPPLWRRLLGGALLATLSTAIFFGIIEGGLRLFGYGHSSRFYRHAEAADGTAILRENRSFVAPWFPEKLIRRPFPFRIPARKPENGFRIFVLGSLVLLRPGPAGDARRSLPGDQIRSGQRRRHRNQFPRRPGNRR